MAMAVQALQAKTGAACEAESMVALLGSREPLTCGFAPGPLRTLLAVRRAVTGPQTAQD